MRPGYFRNRSEAGRLLASSTAAFALLRAETVLVIVPGATHLFEEPGALDEVERRLANGFYAI